LICSCAHWCRAADRAVARGFIAEGYDADLDELRSTSKDARDAISKLEAKYREQTGITALKIKYNGVLGYFIEVPVRYGDQLMAPDSGFTHRQTMAGAMRFNALALHEEASRIAEAGGHALAAEEAHFEELTAAAIAARNEIAQTAAALARIDVAAGQAERAAEGNWCRPVISENANWPLSKAAILSSKTLWARRVSASSPMIARSASSTDCGCWAGRTWAVNRLFFVRMR
jgi:DNA mismatch repair ATPase MutS